MTYRQGSVESEWSEASPEREFVPPELPTAETPVSWWGDSADDVPSERRPSVDSYRTPAPRRDVGGYPSDDGYRGPAPAPRRTADEYPPPPRRSAESYRAPEPRDHPAPDGGREVEVYRAPEGGYRGADPSSSDRYRDGYRERAAGSRGPSALERAREWDAQQAAEQRQYRESIGYAADEVPRQTRREAPREAYRDDPRRGSDEAGRDPYRNWDAYRASEPARRPNPDPDLASYPELPARGLRRGRHSQDVAADQTEHLRPVDATDDPTAQMAPVRDYRPAPPNGASSIETAPTVDTTQLGWSAAPPTGDARTAPIAAVHPENGPRTATAPLGWSASGGDGPPRRGDSNPADAEVPPEPPAQTGPFWQRKHVLLRISAVVVLVLCAAIGVAVTVLRDGDPDTVQVQDDLQADASSDARTPDGNTGTQSEGPTAAEQLAEQQQKIDTAQSRAADKASAAQKTAAETAERAEKAREKRAEAAEESGTSGAPVPTAPVDCNTYSGNKNTGCALLSEYGFETTQMTCLEQLWNKESGWRVDAENPGSGAYGIPQSLPGNKMASVADDWRTNAATQIRWGLGYIKDRYGTPCDAWANFQNNGNY
ncbi:hypothetical protein [Cryptosporangium phraense]|uniref:Transglycosylase SLT domain-containing protein n=1 Tax=Cryptosporangium phraense TaxID=2593070 RepID=A0A545AP37_9ACTN|nr:hypothetical protein [Cryptosporangium phraense]TQS42515.1 hypothetical protein FL583_24785 [Cryptosporangium phraense]